MVLRTVGRTAAALALAATVLAGCAATAERFSVRSTSEGQEAHQSGLHGTLVDPPIQRPDLTLPDTEGEPFSRSARPADEVTVVFFGYTHCPDLCPTTMADLAEARRQLPPAVRDRVTVVFVSEDPERDAPRVLRARLDGMDRDFVGLIGGNEETRRALKQLYLPPTRQVPTPEQPVIHPQDGHDHTGEYGVDHPGVVYAFGPGGSSVIYTGGTTPAQYAEDFAVLAAQR